MERDAEENERHRLERLKKAAEEAERETTANVKRDEAVNFLR
jgi:hypothetical protein